MIMSKAEIKLRHLNIVLTGMDNEEITIECEGDLKGIYKNDFLGLSIVGKDEFEPIIIKTNLKRLLNFYIKINLHKIMKHGYVASEEDLNIMLNFFKYSNNPNSIVVQAVNVNKSIVLINYVNVNKYPYVYLLYKLRQFLSIYPFFEYHVKSIDKQSVIKIFYDKTMQEMQLNFLSGEISNGITLDKSQIQEIKELCSIYVREKETLPYKIGNFIIDDKVIFNDVEFDNNFLYLMHILLCI